MPLATFVIALVLGLAASPPNRNGGRDARPPEAALSDDGHAGFGSARSQSRRNAPASFAGSTRWGGSKWCRSG